MALEFQLFRHIIRQLVDLWKKKDIEIKIEGWGMIDPHVSLYIPLYPCFWVPVVTALSWLHVRLYRAGDEQRFRPRPYN